MDYNRNEKNVFNYNNDIVQELNTICRPLKYLNVEYFVYLRFYDNGDILRLGTNLDFGRYILESGALNTYQDVIDNLLKVDSLTIPFGATASIKEAYSYFNINTAITSFSRKDGYIEAWGVHSPIKEQNLISQYISIIPLIKRFVTYFNYTGKEIIDKALNNKTLYNSNLQITKPGNTLSKDMDIEKFIKATSPNKYKLEYNNNYTPLSTKEIVCLYHLAKGLGYKEIALIAKNSPRTIEKHIANIMIKSGIHSRQKLREIFLKSELNNLLTIADTD